MINRIISTISLAVLVLTCYSQNTVGLLSFDVQQQYEGYTLIYPHNQPNVYLLDNCGRVVHSWEDEADFRPGNTASIQADGTLLKTKRPSAVAMDPIWAGGGGATVEIRSWENDLLWSFTLNDSTARLHHEALMMPDGNVMMLAWERKTAEETIAAGRDTALLTEGELWPDYIFEVRPIGSDSFEMVWEWHVWDHLVQEFDETKDNFGVVADNPHKVDLNYDTSNGEADWMHSNAIDYNPVNDQVMISVPTFDELWIIDHTTTTEEAAGSFGGFSGLGGDLMYRYGNPAAYGRGDAEDQQLFFQHDTKWVDDFLPGSHPDYGKISLYNNRIDGTYSAANILDAPFDMYSWSYDMAGGTWLPADFDKKFVHPDTTLTFSTGLSSVQPLANGNMLVCAGRRGYIYEVTPDEEIVWEYRTPIRGGDFVEQGTVLEVNNNLTFRAQRYPVDFVAFTGRDLSPKGYLELNPDTTFCDQTTSVLSPRTGPPPILYPNPTNSELTIEWTDGGKGMVDIYDIYGRHILQKQGFGGRLFLDISDFTPGIYFVMVNGGIAEKVLID